MNTLKVLIVLGFFSIQVWAGTPLVKDKLITLPGMAGRFDYMKVDATTGRLLAAHKQTGTLTLLNLENDKLLKAVDTGAAQGIAIDFKNGRYFVGDEDEKKIVIINSNSFSKIAEIKVDGPVDAIAYDSKNSILYADQDNGDHVWAIDTNSQKIIAAITLPGEPEFIEYDAVSDRFYQNIKTSNSLVVINPSTNKIESTWSTLPATSPHGLAIDEKTQRVFTAGKNGKLVGLDIKTGKVFATATIGTSVDQISFDPGNKIIFSACKGVISAVKETERGLESLGDIPSPIGAHTLAVDPTTHNVWTSYSDSQKSYLQKFKFIN